MSTPLRDLLTTLLFDPPARAEFAADPEGFLGEHGWADLDGRDVQAALGALVDELPVEQGVLVEPALAHNGTAIGSAVAELQAALAVVDEADPVGAGLDELGPGDAVEAADPSESIDGEALPEDTSLDSPDVDADDDATELDAEVEARFDDGDPATDSLDGEGFGVGDTGGDTVEAGWASGLEDDEPPVDEVPGAVAEVPLDEAFAADGAADQDGFLPEDSALDADLDEPGAGADPTEQD